MSSTNHTTNYNLPQFVGSDKPAWLGDINPAMSAIDTAMHANATTAAQGVSDASTAKDRADAAYTKAGDAERDAGTAQGTANQAVAQANINAGKITALENAFKLDDIDPVTNMNTGTWGNDYKLTLAQNSDGSVFKFYGYFNVTNNSGGNLNVQKPQVAGLTGQYGFATGVYLNTAPTEAYVISPTGICVRGASTLSPWSFWADSIAVGTDGQIYCFVSDVQNESLANQNLWRMTFDPCLYFNTNFGDTPVTPSA